MKLRKTQLLGVFDDHETRIRHIYSHFDYGCGYEQIYFGGFEARHHLGLLDRLHASVYQANSHLRQLLSELMCSHLGSLTLQHLRLVD